MTQQIIIYVTTFCPSWNFKIILCSVALLYIAFDPTEAIL